MRDDIIWLAMKRGRMGNNVGDRKLSYFFDGINGHIQGNDTIGRSGYNLNVSGNVSTGSDADGGFIGFKIDPNSLLVSTTAISVMSISSPFSYTVKIKTGSDVTAVQTIANNIVASSNRVTISLISGELRVGIYNGTSYVGKRSFNITTNTVYVIHYTWDGSSVGKLYLSGVEQTNIPAGNPVSSGTIGFSLSRDGSGFLGYIYHAAIRNKALTQSEVTADVALGNTAKNDPSIVAYYIPENLQYNTQYMSNPTSLDNATRTKSAGVTVTANTTVAPNGTTTADTVAFSGGSSISLYQTNTSITGAKIASKTFIVKAFVKVTAGTSLFRLECGHAGVASYKSSDLTATTTRQEFAFTQTFTSSTSGTGVTGAVVNSSGATNPTLEVRNVRLYIVNEILRDESPNIGGFIGWKTPIVLSSWVKPNINALSNTTSQTVIQIPWIYIHLRGSTNIVYFRSETILEARAASLAGILGTNFTDKVHIAGVRYWDGTGWIHNLYINGVLVTGSQTAYTSTINPASTIYRTNASVGLYTTNYFSGNLRDTRLYVGTVTAEDIVKIYQGGEPATAVKYFQYGPENGEVGTNANDISPNNRDGTLNGGVTRTFI